MGHHPSGGARGSRPWSSRAIGIISSLNSSARSIWPAMTKLMPTEVIRANPGGRIIDKAEGGFSDGGGLGEAERRTRGASLCVLGSIPGPEAPCIDFRPRSGA